MCQSRHDEWSGKSLDSDGVYPSSAGSYIPCPWGNGQTLRADGDGLAGCRAIL